jgi:hypothetical protein
MLWVCLAALPGVAMAQTDYANLDAGRPLRVEDAAVAALWSLDVQVTNLRVERFGSGVTRVRTDPKLAMGIAPFTELELRVPMLYVIPREGSGARTAGVAGMALGALHAFGVETPGRPALAVGAETLLPAGSLAAPHATYTLDGVVTKTLSFARVHVNAGIGSYSVRANAADTTCVRHRFAVPGTDPGCGAPVIPDVPCDASPARVTADVPGIRGACAPPVAQMAAAASPPAMSGTHWSGAVGLDHAFALGSVLAAADIVAERFIGLYVPTDWTAEVGLRRQWSPTLVLDAGLARHFAGVLQSTALIVGGSYAVSLAR